MTHRSALSDQEYVRRIRAEYRRPPSDETTHRHESNLRARTQAGYRRPADRSNYQLVLAAAAVLVVLGLVRAQLGPLTAETEPIAAPAPMFGNDDATSGPVVVTLPPSPVIGDAFAEDGDVDGVDATEPGGDGLSASTSTTRTSATSTPDAGSVAPPTTLLSATSSVLGPVCGDKPATIVGTNGDDVLRGTDGDDVIVARNGNDKIYAGGGDDIICGGGGDDVIRGEAGDDRLWGGNGADTLHGGGGADTLGGGPGDDVLRGGGGADRLWGQAGNDDLDGQWGEDVYGGGGQPGDRCVDTVETGATVVACD